MKKLIILALIALIMVSGCTGTQETSTAGGNQVNTSADADGFSTTIETDDGSVNITGSVSNTGDWCPVGSNWNWEGANEANLSTGSMVILGKEQFKGKEMCHVSYEVVDNSLANAVFKNEFYFSEDGESVYWIMKDSTGNIVQEIDLSE